MRNINMTDADRDKKLQRGVLCYRSNKQGITMACYKLKTWLELIKQIKIITY